MSQFLNNTDPYAIEYASNAYYEYGSVTDYKNYQGNPMPKWEELPVKIQEAWVKSVLRVEELVFEERIDVLIKQVNAKCPANSRELSLVKTNLDQARMWYLDHLEKQKSLPSPNSLAHIKETP